MARKKKDVEVIMPVEDDEAFGLGESAGFYDAEENLDESSGTGELSYYVQTLMLPQADSTMSYLLHREHIGEISIMRKDLFPMKEGFILAYIEYKVL